MHAISSPNSKFSISFTLSTLCRPYCPRTVTSPWTLLFQTYTRHTVHIQQLLIVCYSFKLIQAIPSTNSNFSLSVAVSNLYKPYSPHRVNSQYPLLFITYAGHTVRYSNFSLSVTVSTLYTPYRPHTVTSHFPLLIQPYAHYTVRIQ
jgi:hypothetical protein